MFYIPFLYLDEKLEVASTSIGGQLNMEEQLQETIVQETSIDTQPTSVEALEGASDIAIGAGESVDTSGDITQSQAFSKRLSEMTAKERTKIEAELKSQYEPKVQKLSKLEQIAQEFGFGNVDDYVAAVEEQAAQRRAEQEAQRMQIDLDTYNQYFNPVKQELTTLKQQLDTYKQAEVNRQVQAELKELEADPLFAEHKQDVIDLAINKGYNLKDAFKLVTYDARLQLAQKQKEQEVLENVINRDERQVLSAGDKGNTMKFDVSKMSKSQMDEISRRVQSGERITADQLR